jgi:hypothetical protein
MKKLIYIFLFLFPVVALAQNNLNKLNTTINDRGRIGQAGRTISGNHAGIKSGQAFTPYTTFQGSLTQIYDSIFGWNWDTLSNGWRVYFKSINFTYDENNNLIGEIDLSKVGSDWVNSMKYTSAYDSRHNMTNDLIQIWKDSAWVNSRQYIYTYDASNNLTNELIQTWNSSTWNNVHRLNYTYDSNNNQTSEIYQNWSGSAWVNSFQYEYTYDANNNQISELDQQWNSNSWVNSEEYLYTYDANNKRVSGLDQMWTDSAWVESTQFIYTYDLSYNLINILYKGWYGSSWIIISQSIYSYDDHSNQTSELDQNWNGSTWVNFYQELYSYDANNFQKSSAFKSWNMTGTELEYGDSSYYYFHTVLGINDLKLQHTSITFYPNPATDKITIETAATLTNSQLSIMNLNGQELMTRQITSPKTQIDISNLPNGVYFVRLTNDKTMEVGKFVKQ